MNRFEKFTEEEMNEKMFTPNEIFLYYTDLKTCINKALEILEKDHSEFCNMFYSNFPINFKEIFNKFEKNFDRDFFKKNC